jgi:hypothetical protein
MAALVVRQTGDRRWGLAVWWSLLASPAGWSYYLPLALGPMLGSWPASPIARLGIALLTVPIPILVALGVPLDVLGTRIVGMVYTLGAWLLWIAKARDGCRLHTMRWHTIPRGVRLALVGLGVALALWLLDGWIDAVRPRFEFATQFGQ